MNGGGDDLQVLVAGQFQEVMAARAVESDLDIAFQLQLQEAMAASLALQASSSSAVAPAPAAVAFPPFAPPENEESSVALQLQAMELGKFQQERMDCEKSQAEMRRLSEALCRNAHDQKFAREIQEMDDKEWEDWGDEFEKPIGMGGDEVGETFRVFVKGLPCEELPHLSAFGVSIHDSQGKLVFQIQKPLVGPRPSREILEAMALIEGLTVVLSLGIKSVIVCIDNVALFNHITRRWAIKQRKVTKIIEQIWSLQRNFERCSMDLMARCLMQFVIKLARDAIDSQLTKGVALNEERNWKEMCNICLEETESSHMFAVDACMHRFCLSCMKQHVEVKLLHGILPICPHEGCKSQLNVESSIKFLTPKLVEIMTQRVKEASIPPAEKVYCPYPKCSALMSRSEVIIPEHGSSSKQPVIASSGQRKCIKCNGLFCINCKVPWASHGTMSCDEYKRFRPHSGLEDAKLQDLAKQRSWRQCLKCNQMIELAEGCYHMTCRCGYEFCYTCGAPWNNKKATCTCPLWHEENILYEQEYDEEYDEDEDSDDYDDDGYYLQAYHIGPYS